MNDPVELLNAARIVLLVDWPSPAVPRALLQTGFHVFGASPAGYSRAELAPARPPEAEGVSALAPANPGDKGFLVFRRTSESPPRVDVVFASRPAEELPAIVTRHVVPLHASLLWLHP